MRLAIALILAASATTLAQAHSLIAPGSVQANAAGHFSYEVHLQVSATTQFAYSEWDGTDNTTIGHVTADGFCLQVVPAGLHVITITGDLLNPTTTGTVHYTHALCDSWQATVTTTVIPYPVAAPAQTWSAIKSLYR
jgi:hypothetical protein